jgi:hypothetical protein
MPIPEKIIIDDLYQAFLNRATWKLKFALWPRRCCFSNRWIWFELAYQGTAVWTGPGDPAIEHQWATKEEFIIESLKGVI